MQISEEQRASDVVRNLSEALSMLVEAQVNNHVTEGSRIMRAICEKITKWTAQL